MARLGRPTGPKPGFSREDVVDAAMALGIADFTLSSVAQRLGVATPTLYRTISSRNDLLHACLKRLSKQIDFPTPTGTWQEVLRLQTESMWQMLEDLPGLDRVLLNVPWAYQVFTPGIMPIYRALIAGGLDHHNAIMALDFTGDTILSCHVQHENLRSPAANPPGDVGGKGAAAALEGTDGGTAPRGIEVAAWYYITDENAHGLAPEFTPQESWLDGHWMRHKIEIIIRGIEASL